MSSKEIDVADLIGVANPQPCPQCRHPEIVTLLRRGEPPRALTFYCRHCMWAQGKHALVRDYMEHCGHRFGIVCAACGLETDNDWRDASAFGWRRIGWAWICPSHLGGLCRVALNELLDALEEGHLP